MVAALLAAMSASVVTGFTPSSSLSSITSLKVSGKKRPMPYDACTNVAKEFIISRQLVAHHSRTRLHSLSICFTPSLTSKTLHDMTPPSAL